MLKYYVTIAITNDSPFHFLWLYFRAKVFYFLSFVVRMIYKIFNSCGDKINRVTSIRQRTVFPDFLYPVISRV